MPYGIQRPHIASGADAIEIRIMTVEFFIFNYPTNIVGFCLINQIFFINRNVLMLGMFHSVLLTGTKRIVKKAMKYRIL
jgi:hypothetical protein